MSMMTKCLTLISNNPYNNDHHNLRIQWMTMKTWIRFLGHYLGDPRDRRQHGPLGGDHQHHAADLQALIQESRLIRWTKIRSLRRYLYQYRLQFLWYICQTETRQRQCLGMKSQSRGLDPEILELFYHWQMMEHGPLGGDLLRHQHHTGLLRWEMQHKHHLRVVLRQCSLGVCRVTARSNNNNYNRNNLHNYQWKIHQRSTILIRTMQAMMTSVLRISCFPTLQKTFFGMMVT